MHPNEFDRLAAAFLQSLKVRNLSQGTLKAVAWKLEKFFDYLTACDITHIDHITVETIRSYQIELYHQINRRGRPNSVAYQNGMLSTAKQFITYLKQTDLIVSDPGDKVGYAKPPRRLPRGVLSPTEARKILHAPDTKTVIGYRDRTIMEVLYTSGLRKNEVNNLTLNDVDTADGFLRIIGGKGDADRIVPIGRIACRYLENYIRAVRPELIRDPYNPHLFLSLRGNRMSKNIVWELIKKYAKKAGIKKNVHPHTFRHTCATSMLRNKADLNSIRKILGHRSLNTTQIYTHLSITDLKAVHKRCHPREKDSE